MCPIDQNAIFDHAHERRDEALQRAYEQAENEIPGECECATPQQETTGCRRCAAIQARAEELMGER